MNENRDNILNKSVINWYKHVLVNILAKPYDS